MKKDLVVEFDGGNGFPSVTLRRLRDSLSPLVFSQQLKELKEQQETSFSV